MNKNKLADVKKIINEYYEEKIIDNDNTFEAEKELFQKYEKSIINSINQTAGGTRSGVVGQMSEIVPMFKNYTIENNIKITSQNWKKWYTKNYPDNFEKAFQKIKKMSDNFKKVINELNDEIIFKWLNNFLFIENIDGLLIQDEIIKFLKKEFPDKNIIIASPKEESKNIDLIIDNIKYQIKPLTMKPGTAYQQKWGEEIGIWYKKGIKNNKSIYKFYLPKELYK